MTHAPASEYTHFTSFRWKCSIQSGQAHSVQWTTYQVFFFNAATALSSFLSHESEFLNWHALSLRGRVSWRVWLMTLAAFWQALLWLGNLTLSVSKNRISSLIYFFPTFDVDPENREQPLAALCCHFIAFIRVLRIQRHPWIQQRGRHLSIVVLVLALAAILGRTH